MAVKSPVDLRPGNEGVGMGIGFERGGVGSLGVILGLRREVKRDVGWRA